MEDDRPAAERRQRSDVVAVTELVVVDDRPGRFVPDLDAEAIEAAPARQLTVDGREHEPVGVGSVHRAGSFELRSGTGHHQPLIARGVEREVAGVELELCLTDGCSGAFQIFETNPNVALRLSSPGQSRRGSRHQSVR